MSYQKLIAHFSRGDFLILIAGIHGVGKTKLCNDIERNLGIKCYIASQLIEENSNIKLNRDKKVNDISDNQRILVSVIKKMQKENAHFILDGHFCLINADGKVEKISIKVFERLNPSVIMLVTAQAEVIMLRNKERLNLDMTEAFVEEFQREEVKHALYVGNKLNIPVKIFKENEVDMTKISEYLQGDK